MPGAIRRPWAGSGLYTYPDVVVACGQVQFDDTHLDTLVNPLLIVEVLSASTEKRDRTEKLLSYMNIPTLRAYLLVAQDQPEVEMFYREADGNWWVQAVSGLDASLVLPCPETTLTLADVYESIRF